MVDARGAVFLGVRTRALDVMRPPSTVAARGDRPPRPHRDRAAGTRERMVRDQIEARDVRDPLTLAAMRKVPRHELVPAELRLAAYTDNPLPIGFGQTISQPYVVAFMTEALGLRGGEKVLEVGTGSGYQAAVLAESGPGLHVEIVAPWRGARRRNRPSRLKHAMCARGRLRGGGGGAFDAIASPPPRPGSRDAQSAAEDGGRLVTRGGEYQRLAGHRKGWSSPSRRASSASSP